MVGCFLPNCVIVLPCCDGSMDQFHVVSRMMIDDRWRKAFSDSTTVTGQWVCLEVLLLELGQMFLVVHEYPSGQ